jgi:hypothetical protein
MNINRIIFYHTTWGYLIINILIAKSGSSLALMLIGIRELWMVLLIVFLIMNKRTISLLFLLIIGVYGFIPMIDDFSMMSIMGYVYGFRDIFLIVLLMELLLLSNTDISKKEISIFLITIIILSLLDIMFTVSMGADNSYSLFYNLNEYYSNKGVRTNLSAGFLGDRLTIPLYSPNLLATLFVTFYFLERVIKHHLFIKLLAFIVAVFTLSKVLVVSLFFYISGKWWKINVLLIILSIFPLYFGLEYFYNILEPSLLKYHIASTLGHFNSFGSALKMDFTSFIPDILGHNSTAVRVVSGKPVLGLESLLLSRLIDLKVYFIFVPIYLIYMYKIVAYDVSKKFIAYFLFLSILTATSNQPVAFVPFLYYLVHYKKGLILNKRYKKNES